MSALTAICHGARGSMPISGIAYQRFGGLTTCYELEWEPNHRVIVDAGTGLHHLQRTLDGNGTAGNMRFTMFLTHYHWDHTQGIPFFRPIYDDRNDFVFYGNDAEGLQIEEAIDRVMRPPWFPVTFRSTAAAKTYVPLNGTPVEVEDMVVRSALLNHPSGVTAFRFDRNGKSIVIATDVERGEEASDEKLVELCRGADVLVHDAQYMPDEYEMHKVGWGHSTWRHAVETASRADVGRLILTSHDPNRTDEEVDQIVARCRETFPNTEAAYEGMLITVG